MIRKFKILNDKFNECFGYLYYNTLTEEFKVEMLDSYEGLHPDLYMQILGVEQGKKWIEGHLAENYINGRVIPPNRQALSQALDDMGLTHYSVIDMLDVSHGYCQLDYSHFEEMFVHTFNYNFDCDGNTERKYRYDVYFGSTVDVVFGDNNDVVMQLFKKKGMKVVKISRRDNKFNVYSSNFKCKDKNGKVVEGIIERRKNKVC